MAPTPLSRSERQQQTREALVLAARDVFARDGYHGARLEAIAHEAGYSKGAVYSNFDGKAALFLAVMDVNMAAVGTQGWDPFDTADEPAAGEAPTPAPPSPFVRGGDGRDGSDGGDGAASADEWDVSSDPEQALLDEAMRGFALATLEFVAVAARDPDLSRQLSARMEVLLDLYTAVAATSRDPDDELSTEQVGMLLAAFNQGTALLALGSGRVVGEHLIRTGLQRLTDPGRVAQQAGRAAEHARAGSPSGDRPAQPGRSALHDSEISSRIARSVREAATHEPAEVPGASGSADGGGSPTP